MGESGSDERNCSNDSEQLIDCLPVQRSKHHSWKTYNLSDVLDGALESEPIKEVLQKLDAEQLLVLDVCSETKQKVTDAEHLVRDHTAKLDEMHEKLLAASNLEEALLQERELTDNLQKTIERMEQDHGLEIARVQSQWEKEKHVLSHPTDALTRVLKKESEKSEEPKRTPTSNAPSTTQLESTDRSEDGRKQFLGESNSMQKSSQSADQIDCITAAALNANDQPNTDKYGLVEENCEEFHETLQDGNPVHKKNHVHKRCSKVPKLRRELESANAKIHALQMKHMECENAHKAEVIQMQEIFEHKAQLLSRKFSEQFIQLHKWACEVEEDLLRVKNKQGSNLEDQIKRGNNIEKELKRLQDVCTKNEGHLKTSNDFDMSVRKQAARCEQKASRIQALQISHFSALKQKIRRAEDENRRFVAAVEARLDQLARNVKSILFTKNAHERNQNVSGQINSEARTSTMLNKALLNSLVELHSRKQIRTSEGPEEVREQLQTYIATVYKNGSGFHNSPIIPSATPRQKHYHQKMWPRAKRGSHSGYQTGKRAKKASTAHHTDDLLELSSKHDKLKQKYIRQSRRQSALQKMILDQRGRNKKKYTQPEIVVEHILKPNGSSDSPKKSKPLSRGMPKSSTIQLQTVGQDVERCQSPQNRTCQVSEPRRHWSLEEQHNSMLPTLSQLTGAVCNPHYMDQGSNKHREIHSDITGKSCGQSTSCVEAEWYRCQSPPSTAASSREGSYDSRTHSQLSEYMAD